MYLRTLTGEKKRVLHFDWNAKGMGIIHGCPNTGKLGKMAVAIWGILTISSESSNGA